MKSPNRQLRNWSMLTWFYVAIVLLMLPALGSDARAAEKVAATLLVSDILSMPGQSIKLEAQLRRDAVLTRGGLGGEKLEFFLQGKKIGTALTGGDGRAFLEATPKMRGNQTIMVRLTSSPRVQDVEGTGLLASWERRRPILFVDIMALMQERQTLPELLPSLSLNVGGQNLGVPDTDAAHELKKLGEFYYNVIYLNRAGNVKFEEAREWLRSHQFPSSLTKSLKPGRLALDSLINDLKEGGWDNLDAGIGRTPEFAEALVEHRIRAVIFPLSGQEDKFPKRAVLVEKWKDVRKNL